MMSGWRERKVEIEKDFRRAGRATQANRRYLVLRGVAPAHVSVCSMKYSQTAFMCKRQASGRYEHEIGCVDNKKKVRLTTARQSIERKSC
jgi:hypothetical protein